MILPKKGRKTEFFMVDYPGHCATFSQKLGFFSRRIHRYYTCSVMNQTTNLMKQKILSILRGEQYTGSERGWDALDVWADAVDFYHSLDNAIERADFERTVAEFLYGGDKALRRFALTTCRVIRMRSAIPWLLAQLQQAPDGSDLELVCMALARMRVSEAVDFFEMKERPYDLFRVDFHRSIPLIQQLIERTCARGYEKEKASKPPRPPLHELEQIFYELYSRFGSKGIFLLLDELKIYNDDQRQFVLDAVREVCKQMVSDAVMAIYKKGETIADDEIKDMKTESLKLVEKVRQWLLNRPDISRSANGRTDN